MLLVRLWDLLIGLLIFFPMLSGGVWIKRPGLFIEHTELAVPTVIALLLSWLWVRALGVDLRSSWVIRICWRAWRLWADLLDKHALPVLLATSAITGAIWSFASLRKHWAFATSSYDLGIFTNTIWNLVNGNGYFSSIKGGINLLLDHQSPIFWLFAPVYLRMPKPEILLILQAAGLALGAIPFYYLSAQYLKRSHWFTVAAPLLYWSYLPLRNANAFEFHPEVLMLPLFLTFVAGIQSDVRWKNVCGWIAFALALTCKESAGPVAVGIGLAWFLGASPEFARDQTRRAARITLAAGIVAFIIDLWVIPATLGGKYAYSGLFAQYGDSLLEYLFAPILKPAVFWSHIFGPARIKYLFWALLPLGFLPVLNWRAFVAAIPGFVMLFASAGAHRVNIQYHYIVESGVGLFWAMPLAVATATHYVSRRSVVLWVLLFALVGFGRSEIYRIRNYQPSASMKWIETSLLPCLNPDISLAASDPLVPHLSNRRWIQNLSGANEYTSCVVVDSALSRWPLSVDEWSGLNGRLAEMGFVTAYECQTTRIFQLRGSEAACLRCLPDCPAP